MAKHIKIRETLYNVDKFIKIEEFKDFQELLFQVSVSAD